MTRRRGEASPIGIGWLLTWPLSIVFAAMLFLTVEEIRRPSQSTGPAPSVGEDWQGGFSGRVDAVTQALEHFALPLSKPVEEDRGSGSLRWTHRLFEARLPLSDKERVEAALADLRKVDPGITLTSSATYDGAEVRVGLDGLLTHTLRLHFRDTAQRARVALVVGALGDDLRAARAYVDVDAPIALAVRPFRPFSREVAELGHMFQREILLDWDGSEGPSLAAQEGAGDPLRRRLSAAVATVPHAVGVAGGAAATSPVAGKMRDTVVGAGLFYLGPGDAPVALIALGADPGAEEHLKELLAAARDQGRAIGLSPSGPDTAAALPALLERLRKENVDLVPVSALAGKDALSAG